MNSATTARIKAKQKPRALSTPRMCIRASVFCRPGMCLCPRPPVETEHVTDGSEG
jgi:hypothetical protein